MRNFFQAREFNGEHRWDALSKDITFVITHPNGWTLAEQECLRKAVIQGGLISESPAAQAVFMLPEAEASVHFILFYGGGNVELEVCQ